MRYWETQTKIQRVRVVLACLIVLAMPMTVYGQSSSTNYSVDESFIGPGGLLDSSSANFEARASLGDTGVGNSASANFQAYAGFTTTDEEFLEMTVNTNSVDLGDLTTGATATGSGTFSVRNYLSKGYVVTTVSQPPTNGAGDTLEPLASATAASAGTEQFGINLAANTSPTSFGAEPVQLPDITFSFGTAATGYDTPNVYKYTVGDTIAESSKSTGITDYTISYIANVGPITEAGVYTMEHDLVVVSTF